MFKKIMTAGIMCLALANSATAQGAAGAGAGGAAAGGVVIGGVALLQFHWQLVLLFWWRLWPVAAVPRLQQPTKTKIFGL